ncbi:MAG TPA: lipase family protein [Mycobacteriales bacterium]|nr:lipase family protein [Mycobacteriales bacterium]
MMRAAAAAAISAAMLLVPGGSATADVVTSGTSGVLQPHVLPSKDPFYRYGGQLPLRRVHPGTVLRSRPVTLALPKLQTPISATQLLYRTRDELGHPSVEVTTVVVPLPVPVQPRILAYLSFYDALGSECDPSYTLRGGYAGNTSNENQAKEEDALVVSNLAQGLVVTVPDFEGTDEHWAAGHEAGYGTLDAIRATESFLDVTAATKVGMYGYSGGSIAADWAAELAPRYAPALNLVGVAMGGIPVDLAHNLRYVNGSRGWSGVVPAVMVSLTRAFHLDLAKYGSAYGAKIFDAVKRECIGSFLGAYPGLRVERLVKHRYRHILQVPAFTRIANRLIMGSVPGHPIAPFFMAVGNADGVGDGVMVARDVEALAHEYCDQGDPVELQIYKGATHTEAALHFESPAVAYLLERFAGVRATGSCSSIPRGSSLAPLPT